MALSRTGGVKGVGGAVSWQEQKARVLSVCLSVGAARLGQVGKATSNNLGEKG